MDIISNPKRRPRAAKMRAFKPISFNGSLEATSSELSNNSDSTQICTSNKDLVALPDVRVNPRKSGFYKFFGVKPISDTTKNDVAQNPEIDIQHNSSQNMLPKWHIANTSKNIDIENATPLQHCNMKRRKQLMASTPFAMHRPKGFAVDGDLSSILEKSPRRNSIPDNLEMPPVNEVQEAPLTPLETPRQTAMIVEPQAQASDSQTDQVLKPITNLEKGEITPKSRLVVILSKEIQLMKSDIKWLKHKTYIRRKLKRRKRTNRTVNNCRNFGEPQLNKACKRRSKSLGNLDENLDICEPDDMDYAIQDALNSKSRRKSRFSAEQNRSYNLRRSSRPLTLKAISMFEDSHGQSKTVNIDHKKRSKSQENLMIEQAIQESGNGSNIHEDDVAETESPKENCNLRKSTRSLTVSEKSHFHEKLGNSRREWSRIERTRSKSQENQIIEEPCVSEENDNDSDIEREEIMHKIDALNAESEVTIHEMDCPKENSNRKSKSPERLNNEDPHICNQDVIDSHINRGETSLNLECKKELRQSSRSSSVKEKTLLADSQIHSLIMDRISTLYNLEEAKVPDNEIKKLDMPDNSSNNIGEQPSCSHTLSNIKETTGVNMHSRRPKRRCRPVIVQPDLEEFKLAAKMSFKYSKMSLASSKFSIAFNKKSIASNKRSIAVQQQNDTCMKLTSSADSQETQRNLSNVNTSTGGCLLASAGRCINRSLTVSQTICGIKFGNNFTRGIQVVGKMAGPIKAPSDIVFSVYEGVGYLCDANEIPKLEFSSYESFIVPKGDSFILKKSGRKRCLLGYVMEPGVQ